MQDITPGAVFFFIFSGAWNIVLRHAGRRDPTNRPGRLSRVRAEHAAGCNTGELTLLPMPCDEPPSPRIDLPAWSASRSPGGGGRI